MVEALRPYVVASSYAANAARQAAEIEDLARAAGLRRRSNIQCYVLDPKGRLVRGFDAFPERMDDGMSGPPGGGRADFEPGRMVRYLLDEVAKSSKQLGLRPDSVPARPLQLPDAGGKAPLGGLRVFARFEGGAAPMNYKAPVVDALEVKEEERRLLSAWDGKEIEADGLRRWFQPLFPPALMEERACAFREVTGKLSLRRADGQTAVLRGRVGLVMDGSNTTIAGDFEAVLTLTRDPLGIRTLRAVFEGRYERRDPGRGVPRPARVTAAFESRPE